MSEKILEEYAIGRSLKFKDCINTIMNSTYFRKLAEKTQVIISLTGPNVRTRLTHTVEVARIARDLAEDLGLNEDLAEAIALAHDIGHTPFGHVRGKNFKRDYVWM
jgi:dGTPase